MSADSTGSEPSSFYCSTVYCSTLSRSVPPLPPKWDFLRSSVTSTPLTTPTTSNSGPFRAEGSITIAFVRIRP